MMVLLVSLPFDPCKKGGRPQAKTTQPDLRFEEEPRPDEPAPMERAEGSDPLGPITRNTSTWGWQGWHIRQPLYREATMTSLDNIFQPFSKEATMTSVGGYLFPSQV